ncbi:MAG: 30S ribosomal protein S16 [Patescibacteria group bacterium]
MLIIRMSRVGKTREPSYRVLVQDKTKDPWGNALETVGFVNPRTKPKTIKLDQERIKFWISKGAKASPSVHNILVDAKILTGDKMNATFRRKKAVEAKPAEKAEKKAA